MKVVLASPRGFCAGVEMAVNCLDLALDLYGPPVYVFHEIVHNKHIVTSFKDRGVIFVDEITQVPSAGLLLFSAHGVSPQVRSLASFQKLRTIDATCPLVAKVHLEAKRFAKDGYQIVLVGHKGHDEVVGTVGEVPDRIHIVENEADVDALPLSSESKIAYLTQTTLSVDDADRVVRHLRRRYPQIQGPPREDICYATQNRQEAVKQLAVDCDVVLVLGSDNSSNSRRLQEIATLLGKRAYLVDDASEIRSEWFEGIEKVLVTAGASAPDSVVKKCVQYLRDKYGASVEKKSITEENVHFAIPKELRVYATRDSV